VRLTSRNFSTFAIFLSLIFSTKLLALPEQCLQSSFRSEPCPHLIYKKSPIDIAKLSIKTGDMVCVCLTDVSGVREATVKALSSPELQVTLSRFAADWALSESELLLLIRK
jgi:hypothetical protein